MKKPREATSISRGFGFGIVAAIFAASVDY
jgi:hypothetical protein